MTTTTPQSSTPPIQQIGAWEWAKKNLFSSWFNTLLTIVTVLLITWITTSLFTWAVTQAEWGVLRDNFRLLLIGRYPVQALWQIWLGLGIMVGLGGIRN